MLKARWLFSNKVMEQVIMSLFYLTLQKIDWFSNSVLCIFKCTSFGKKKSANFALFNGLDGCTKNRLAVGLQNLFFVYSKRNPLGLTMKLLSFRIGLQKKSGARFFTSNWPGSGSVTTSSSAILKGRKCLKICCFF